MKASELRVGDWFKWGDDWRVFERLTGEQKEIEGKNCIPVKPLLPTPRSLGGYIPADDEVELDKSTFLRIA